MSRIEIIRQQDVIVDYPYSPRGDGNVKKKRQTIDADGLITLIPREGTETTRLTFGGLSSS